MKTTFKTIVIKSHQQTMDEFAAICDATIKGEKVEPEEVQYSFTSFEAARASGIPQEVVEAHVLSDVPMIRAWREHIGITQAELAVRMGVSQAAVAKLERPDAKPRSATLKKIAEALGISPAQLDVKP